MTGFQAWIKQRKSGGETGRLCYKFLVDSWNRGNEKKEDGSAIWIRVSGREAPKQKQDYKEKKKVESMAELKRKLKETTRPVTMAFAEYSFLQS